ncbi:MAG: DUF885 domain-containing protein [Candidatus Obscuribacter sp.]|nr:DUF885 domain-containing protein [Candidatus Obscuribacter sp.]
MRKILQSEPGEGGFKGWRVSFLATLLLSSMLASPLVQAAPGADIAALSPSDTAAPGSNGAPVPPLGCKSDACFDKLVDEYFEFAFSVSPTWGTAAGFHEYDQKLEDLSKDALKRNLAANKVFLTRLEKIAVPDLSRTRQLDRLLLMTFIKGQIFDQEELRWLERDPDRYSSLIADSVFSLTKRNFAPASARLTSVCARLEKAPALIDAARQNLVPQEVPKIYAEVAAEQLAGTVSMLKTTIPEAFASVKDEGLKARFSLAQKNVLTSLAEYEVFLKEKVLPVAGGSYAIGEKLYSRKLSLDEMEDEKLSLLLERGYKELKRLQSRFVSLGRSIDASRPAGAVFEDIAREHPAADELVAATQGCLDRLAKFCQEESIVTIPSEDRVTVAESPSYLRALTFASMDTPGPYESKAKEAFYYVTPAEKNWDPKRIEEHLRFFSHADIINTSVHEAYPGHYVQFLWVKHAPSKVRKLLGCSSNAEGWAHYCEEMMVQEGLVQPGTVGRDDKLAMVQVHDALLRVCRYIVGIEMHTRGLSFEKAVAFFMKEGFMEKANAERETKRGTKDPTYLVYTLGKLKILAIRDEYKAKMGAKYSLKDFHDAFLKCGFPPLKIVRAELLDLPVPEAGQ